MYNKNELDMKMKKFIQFLAVGLLLMVSPAVAQEKPYSIHGKIKGLGASEVYLVISPAEGERKSDTLVTRSVGDEFKFSGKVAQPRRAALKFGVLESREEIQLYVEPGDIKVAGDIDSRAFIFATGTKNNDELAEALRYLNPIYARRSALQQKVRNRGEGEPEIAGAARELRLMSDSINSYRVQFIERYPDSEVSLGYLYVLHDGMPIEQAERLYNSLSPDLKSSSTGEYILRKMQAKKLVAVGNKAPDFSSKDTSGAEIKLSDFRGKYVFLEFWAQWCVPCRAQHPHLKATYEKFGGSDFTILQYSLDTKRDEEKWKAAIVQDGLVWPQVSDLPTNGRAPVAELYGVQPIPDNFLISPDGTILGRRLSPKELDETLARLLGQ